MENVPIEKGSRKNPWLKVWIGLGVLLVIVLGASAYEYFKNAPRNIRVSNVTDSSFTVSWITDSPVSGRVFYSERDIFLPGPLVGLASQKAYDDRDVARAQSKCVQEFNKKASEAMTDAYVVTMENFSCEDVPIQEENRYYTHHVTITDLEPEKTYYFRIGDKLISFAMGVDSVKTFPQLEEVGQPIPIFGRVLNSDGAYSEDSVIYATFSNGRDGKESILYSGVTNEEGGWYLDGSYIRTDAGELVGMEVAQDFFNVRAQYKNYGLGELYEWVFGSFGLAYPDIVVDREVGGMEKSSLLGRFGFEVVAGPTEGAIQNSEPSSTSTGSSPESSSPTSQEDSEDSEPVDDRKVDTRKIGVENDVCQFGNYSGCKEEDFKNNVDTWGAGNVAAAYADEFNDGKIDATVLEYLGLGDNPSMVAANLSAISGEGITVAKYEEAVRDQKEIYVDAKNPRGGVISRNPEIPDPSPPPPEDGSPLLLKVGWVREGLSQKMTLNGVSVSGILAPTEQEKLDAYIKENCDDQKIVNGTCQVPVEAIELTDFVFLTSYSDEIVSCLEDPNCDPGGTKEGYIRKTELLMHYVSQSKEASLVADAEPLGESISAISEDCRKNLLSGSSCQDLNAIRLVLYGNSEGSTPTNPEEWKNATITKVKSGDCDILCVRKLANLAGYTRGGSYYNPSYNNLEESLEQLQDTLEKLKEMPDTSSGTINLSPKTIRNILKSKIYAQDPSETDQKVFFLPEYGTYTLEFGPFKYEGEVTDGKTLYLFYFETNNESGFQIDEDYVLESFASEITYEKTASAKTVTLSEGINMISFDWLPAFNYENVYTAKDLAQEIDSVEFVAYYEGGRWSKGISCGTDGVCNGSDFSLTPGKGYLIKARKDTEVVLPGYQITSPVPVPFSSGWNLVGVHGYPKAYSARSFIESVNRLEGLTADNVSWWSTSAGRYEGVQVTEGTQYGIDFPINPSVGYFVRISEFLPSSTECKSIIWNEGGDLDGKCGHSKSIF